jgi:hypothetical protein
MARRLLNDPCPAAQPSARTLAALSSVAVAPPRLPPPPCHRTHGAPLATGEIVQQSLRRPLLLLVVLLLLADCGRSGRGGRDPIRAGQPITLPALAAVVNRSAPVDDLLASYRCAGTLVTPTMVATARHCVADARPRSLDVVVGAENLCRTAPVGGERRPVVEIHVPADAAQGGDLAVLELGAPSSQPPAAIGRWPSVRHRLTAIGWGRGGPVSTPCSPWPAPLRAQTGDACDAALRARPEPVRGRLGCAVPDGGRNTCQGDSGGPVLALADSGPLLVGITSSGLGCGPRDLGFYLRVDRYARWLGKLGAAPVTLS